MATAPNNQEDQEPNAVRMGLRRARMGAGGFSSGVSSQTESYRAEDEAEVDRDLNERVRSAPPRLAAPASGEPQDPDDNRRMLFEATMAGDASYAREFRLGMLNRLLMRGISLDNIARELGVSISTVKNDRSELRRRLRESAKGLDINEIIGGQMAFYDEVSAMSLRVSSQQGVPTAMKLASLRTALAAKADQTRFLTSAGVFDVLSFRRTEDGQDLSDVQMLMQRTEEMLSRIVDGEDPIDGAESATPAKPVRVLRRQRAGGFSAMSFDDKSASGSGEETVEL